MGRNRLGLIGAMVLVGLNACALPQPLTSLRPAATTARQASVAGHPLRQGRGAGAYTFDNFKVGTSFADVVGRQPYAQPCDTDPIDNRQRMLVLYTAKMCRGYAFPETTNAAFLLNVRTDTPLWANIASFAYLGGTYFNKRSDFPIPVGAGLPAAGVGAFSEVLAEPLSQELQIGSPSRPLQAARFGADLYVLHDRKTVVGIVAGAMPDDVRNEQWQVVYSLWPRSNR